MTLNQRINALLLGSMLAVGLSMFIRFGYPFVPVPTLVGIVLACRLAKSGHWRVGLTNGSVIGLAESLFRLTAQPTASQTPMNVGIALVFVVVLYGVVGIGINKLVVNRGTVIW